MSSKGERCVAEIRPQVLSCSTSRKAAAATRLLTPPVTSANDTLPCIYIEDNSGYTFKTNNNIIQYLGRELVLQYIHKVLGASVPRGGVATASTTDAVRLFDSAMGSEGTADQLKIIVKYNFV